MQTLFITSGSTKLQHSFTAPIQLGELLREAQVHMQMPCGGNQRCGKCKIRVSGELSPMTEAERAFLTEEEIQEGYRLACFTTVSGDASVVLTGDRVFALSAVEMPHHQLTEQGFGIAVDIGTTTVAMQMYRLETGELVGEALGANAQAGFGADVISRIDYANHNGAKLLEDAIRNQLNTMAEACMKQAGTDHIDDCVVTGNTTMLHFWEGLDASGIAVAPFTPQSLFGETSHIPLHGKEPFLPPCLGSYIGADITCAILASDMMNHPEETSLLVDMGTNGEIALRCKNGDLMCASTALGPAFEGANLDFGMQAAPGAISAVDLVDGEVVPTVLGGVEAIGLCGSGVLDAVRVMLELEVLGESGRIDKDAPGVTDWKGEVAWQVPGTEVFVTQRDIRQIQMAKAAVSAGIDTLLDAADLKPEDVDRFYIAGGFGHRMNLESGARIGLFPPQLAPKTTVLGNAALSGADLLLLDRGSRIMLKQVADGAREIPLSGNETFSDQYVERMAFEEEEVE